MEPCYYCDIASGKEQRVHIAFEDDRAMAVLVTEPMNPGQLFLVPKAHVTTLDEMGEENTAHLFEITRRLVQAIRKAGIRCEGTEVHLSEQPTSLLPHLVVQLLPRFEGDSLWTEARISRHRSSWDFEARRLLWWEELAARRLDGAWTLRREVSDEEFEGDSDEGSRGLPVALGARRLSRLVVGGIG